NIVGEIEHGLFHRRRFACLRRPRRIDIDVAGGAGAGAAAISVDARHAVLDRDLHHRLPNGRVDDMLFAVLFDVGDLRHGALTLQSFAAATISFIGRDSSSSAAGATLRRVWINSLAPKYSAGRFTASTAINRPPL